MAVNWTNNFNDGQSTDTITANTSGAFAYNSTAMLVSSLAKDDSDGVGRANWKVDDTFFLPGSASTLYTISAITYASTYATLCAAQQPARITFTPGIVEAVGKGVVITKEDSYKGNQGSAARHLRLRNQGLI